MLLRNMNGNVEIELEPSMTCPEAKLEIQTFPLGETLWAVVTVSMVTYFSKLLL